MNIRFDKFFYFLIPVLFIFPLLKESFISLMIILLSVNTLFYLLQTKKFSLNKEILIFTIPFLIVLFVSVIKFESLNDLKPLQNALLFLIFPVLFFNIPKKHFSLEKINLYFEILKYTLLIIALTYYFSFFYYYDFNDLFVYKYNIPKFRDYIYNEIPFFKIHPTYYTSIALFSITRSFDQIINKKKYSELFFIVFFPFTIFTFLAKFNLIFLLILFGYIVFFRLKLTSFKKITLSILIFLFSLSCILYIPGIKNRFYEMVNSYNNPPIGMEYDSTNIRVSIIKCSSSIAKENFWFGIGYNNIESELLQCYKENFQSNFYKEKKYLTHNYFMYILLGGGVISLLIYLLFLYKVFVNIKFINTFLLTVTMINIFLLNFTEDFFYRQKGLFYFSLIFFTFLMHKKQISNHE
ncbi:O-antigen ligase family protein [Flavobacterium jumunjinense]|uniref:O-antigen ligase family protein n=1 Tax=Flavobacterium jumunjinense TaxID=998845 RepID=UPI0039EFD0D6